ncbi:MAG: polysaccharide pyruvyl transferase family protein [Armatimonadota bacterium]
MLNIYCIRPKGFNVGNDAIFLGLQQYIYQAFGHMVNLIALPATSRYESHAKAGLSAESVYEINQHGHGVIIGGGNLYENGELEVNQQALRALEPPLMLFSLSYGRVYNRDSQLVPRTNAMPESTILGINNKAACSLARDKSTFNYLASIGVENCRLGGCPTVFLNRMEERLPRLSNVDSGGVLISVRNPELMSISTRIKARVHGDICGVIRLLRDRGYENIRLLCHDHRDIPFAASFEGMEFVYAGDVYYYLSMLRQCDLSVSYRLHSSLPCYALGTPSVKISYDERSLSMMDTLGLSEWNIDMIKTQSVLDEVEDRLENLDRLSDLLTAARPTWETLDKSTGTAMSSFAAAVRDFAGDRK